MKYLFLNHKMHLTFEEIGAYKRDFEKLSWDFLEVAVFPSFVYLPCFMEQSYLVASQDVSSFDLGAHTGEIGAKQLKELQVKYSLVGHSERRKKDCEEEIHEKIQRLQEVGIIPVLCVGDEDRRFFEETLKRQLSSAIDSSVQNLIIAYEPIYSIGTGVVLENEEIEKSVAWIKNFVQENYQKNFPVLYGGSVDEKNIGHLSKISNVDGFLVGKASLDVQKVKVMLEELK